MGCDFQGTEKNLLPIERGKKLKTVIIWSLVLSAFRWLTYFRFAFA